MDTALLVKALGGFFAIMNPFVALPLFLSLTTGYDAARQRTTAIRVAIYSLVMAVVIMAGRFRFTAASTVVSRISCRVFGALARNFCWR